MDPLKRHSALGFSLHRSADGILHTVNTFFPYCLFTKVNRNTDTDNAINTSSCVKEACKPYQVGRDTNKQGRIHGYPSRVRVGRGHIVTASKSLPKCSPGIEKDWWCPELTLLRDQNITIQSLWIQEGRPKQGPTYQERLRVRAAYKNSIRMAKRSSKQTAWNRLHSAMESEDTTSFWRWWKSIYGNGKCQTASVVNGTSSKEGIAKAFQTAFQENSKPNNAERVKKLDSDFREKHEEFSANHAQNCDCNMHTITLENTIDAVFEMKPGKSSDDDGINAEHFQNGPLILYIKLSSLFNHMLKHAFVPNQFRFGTITPIIKDRHGNTSDVSNYRGITISAMPSKIFEHVLKVKFSHYLSTSSFQYGFKNKSSTSHALFCLKQTISYYIDHGSRTYCAFLDASKAFDRLVHSGLFIKLMDRGVPKCFLDILITWYDGLQCRIKWDDYLGDWFHISAGVRQGGVLSPNFYNIYVDSLIDVLRSSDVGCYVAQLFAAAIFYADDMCILSPSLKGLQKLLDLCSAYCMEWDICLNPKKSKILCFGKPINSIFKPKLNGTPIDWVHEWKYLGVMLKSGQTFGCSVVETVKSFYRSLNSILRVEGRSDDVVLLRLIEAHCVPVLTYAIEIVHVANRDERRSLRVAYNSIFRKLFAYRTYESVTNLQHFLGRKTWEELVDSRTSGFMHRVKSTEGNPLISLLC